MWKPQLAATSRFLNFPKSNLCLHLRTGSIALNPFQDVFLNLRQNRQGHCGSGRNSVEQATTKSLLSPNQNTISRGKERSSLEGRKLSIPDLAAKITTRFEQYISKSKDGEYTEYLSKQIKELGQIQVDPHKARLAIDSFRSAFVQHGEDGLRAQVDYAYQEFLQQRKFGEANVGKQESLLDLRYPIEWYPATRSIQRTIHLHVGPTNSGKTYHALKRLEQANSGVYAGPLRLLAHEVYTRLNAYGIPCNLLTGDEVQIVEGNGVKMCSCTVEMVPINNDVDVAVIDEIQMIGHEERGWAWTQALLGLKAKELHLCGEERAAPLIKELAIAMGDKLEIHHYQRLSPLRTMSSSLRGDFRNLKKGDCVVAFSRVQIHAFKQKIEKATKKRVAIVYGSLPPEIRAKQASLFNDPNNDYDFLVASDAIGMGLNLSIKRIIFSTISKFNGEDQVPIEDAQIKQIAGRAGRYRVAPQLSGQESTSKERHDIEESLGTAAPNSLKQNLGLVTALNIFDLSRVDKSMQTHAEPIMSAGLFPPAEILMKFAAYFPLSTPFSYILMRLHKTCLVHSRFHMCVMGDHFRIAEIIEPIRSLTVSDRIIFCASPANLRDDRMIPIVRAFAECVGNNRGGSLLDIPDLNLKLLNVKTDIESKDFLDKLESLHKALVLYTWLSYRFAGVFTTQAMAFYIKSLVEEKIQQALSHASSKVGTRGLGVPVDEKTIYQKLSLKEEAPTARREIPNAHGKVTDFERQQTLRKINYLPHLVRRIEQEIS